MSDESINQSSVKEDMGLYLEIQIQNGLDKVSKIWKTKLLGKKIIRQQLRLNHLWSEDFVQSFNVCSMLYCLTKTVVYNMTERNQTFFKYLQNWLYTEEVPSTDLSFKIHCFLLMFNLKSFPLIEVNLSNYFNTLILLLAWGCIMDRLCA